MKAYYKRPKKELLIVRPNNEGDEYEFYILVPKLVGSAVRAGTQRILYNGNQYTNLNGAFRQALQDSGDLDMVGEIDPWVKKPDAKMLISGVDLVARNAWLPFCKLRGMSNTHDNIGKQYYLNKAEQDALGLGERPTQPPEITNAPRSVQTSLNKRARQR